MCREFGANFDLSEECIVSGPCLHGPPRLGGVRGWGSPPGRDSAGLAGRPWSCGRSRAAQWRRNPCGAEWAWRTSSFAALNSPQADQTPTNRSFRDLILSSRCFALLKRAGLFGARPAARVAWPEWAAALGDAIKRAPAAGDPDDGSTFYRHWLASLERLVAEKGLASPEILDERRAAWDRAARDPARAADPAGQRPAERAP